MISAADYATALFITGWHYWFIDDELGAAVCWATALDVINTVSFVGEA